MGGICFDLGFAWQCSRRVFVPFLNSAKDSQKDKLHINAEELLALQLGKFLLLSQDNATFMGATASPPTPPPATGALSSFNNEVWGDNHTAQGWLRKNRAKHFFLSILVSITDSLTNKCNTAFLHTTCSSKQMEYAGADVLSRFRRRRIFGIPVLLVTRAIFEEFTSFFSSGTRDHYLSLLSPLLSHKVSQDFLFYIASFAAYAKQDKTNNKRIRDS